jgi:predicted Ser/Thr protein kinase
MEYADLLKRPLEAFKYLLGFSETGEVPMEHFVLQLDEVLVASSNEKHLAGLQGAAPTSPASRAASSSCACPYLRRWKSEKEIYDAQVTTRTVGKHVAPTRPRSPPSGRCSPG